MLAAIRPDDWNFPLLLHVFGALVLVGALGAAVAFGVVAWRGRDAEGERALGRLAFRSLLFAAFPAWWLMRIGAEWIYSKENLDDVPEDPAWLGIGYITAEGGGLLIVISIILIGIGVRRMGRGETPRPSVLVRIGTVLVSIVLAAYIVAVWAMTTKPD